MSVTMIYKDANGNDVERPMVNHNNKHCHDCDDCINCRNCIDCYDVENGVDIKGCEHVYNS